MFESKKSKNEAAALASNEMNHIAAGTKIIGDIITKGNFRLDGELEGNLLSESRVVLGITSFLNGTLKAQSAEVSGKIKGVVEVSEELVLRKTASLEGEVVTGSLNIDSGAEFNGTTKMGKVLNSMVGNDTRKEKTA